MRRKILITGGAGLLALNWAQSVRDRHDVVLGTHRRQVNLAGVESRQLDLTSEDAVLRAIDDVQPQWLAHTAGLTSVEACEKDPELARQSNVVMPMNIAKACARRGVKLIHISTDHLFSLAAPLLDESHPVSPMNTYGKTKAEAEVRVLEADPQALVVRTNFYAWGPSYRQSFSDAILTALQERRPYTLFQDVFYNPILCEPLALTIHDLVERQANGIFHVVADERLSKHDFGLRLAQHFELDAAPLRAGRLAEQTSLVRRPLEMSLSNQKARQLLGRPLGSVDEQIERLKKQRELKLAREVQAL
ncbi:SDR family oxidoreductase [Steroidobacter flavus]|uniref:dTDP-4-dehydrorhamnose reductase n=1 Tax=Steroidobacter flavus TaxID=1842136 RepID=A0ABV8T4Q0_9GAMM